MRDFRMIPRVKPWHVNVVGTGRRIRILAPTKVLAKLNFRFEYPEYWGCEIKISLARNEIA